MKTKILFAIMPLVLVALMFAGCSSNSSSTPAPTTRTQATTGVVTGFGSVFVNGIEFTKNASVTDADAVTFKFDDTHPGQAGLKIGMMVTVKGAVDPATNKGEFESIEFNPEVRGPADSLTSAASNTIKIMGHDVVTSATTSFEGTTAIPTLTDLKNQLAGAKHPEVEVSGHTDSAGVFHATRLSVKADDFGVSGKVNLHGKITSAPTDTTGGKTFDVGGTVIRRNGDLPYVKHNTGLIQGAAVEVKGTLSDGVLTADRIESNKGVGEGVEVEDNVSIQGIATGSLSGGSFTLNGPNGVATISVNNATVFSGGAGDASIVAANAMVEVEGTLQADGTVLATKVKSETEIENETHGGEVAGGGETGGGGGGGGGTTQLGSDVPLNQGASYLAPFFAGKGDNFWVVSNHVTF